MERGHPPKFTCFADFPLEIRTNIWEFAAFLPRDVDIWAQQLGTLTHSAGSRDRSEVFRYVSTQPPPAMLYVNMESRTVGLKYYRLEFGSADKVQGLFDLITMSPPKTFINLRCDRICPLGHFDFYSFPWVFDPRPDLQIDQRLLDCPLRIAINVVTAFLAFPADEDDFISACTLYEEVLLYYLQEPDFLQVPGRGDRMSIEFIPMDITTKGDRGLCFELNRSLDSFHAAFDARTAENSRLLSLGLSDEPIAVSKGLRPNVNWVTLVVNGQKVGLQ